MDSKHPQRLDHSVFYLYDLILKYSKKRRNILNTFVTSQSTYITRVKKEHALAEQLNEEAKKDDQARYEIVAIQTRNDTWELKSPTHNSDGVHKKYTITKVPLTEIDPECCGKDCYMRCQSLKCHQFCKHQFTCSCDKYERNREFCQHLHYLFMWPHFYDLFYDPVFGDQIYQFDPTVWYNKEKKIHE